MHEQLEAYLAEVAKQLASIPKPRRDEELKEIRQHLLSAVSAHQESGQSEAEATANALADFGTPEVASANILLAWWIRWRTVLLKDYCKAVGVFSVAAAFQVQSLSPNAADQHRCLWGWVSFFVFLALALIGPFYLPTNSVWRWIAAGRWPR
jgi:hypothetical protein